MTWDVTYDDGDSQHYRVRAKALTVRDGIAADKALSDITHRFAEYELLWMMQFPLCLHGTAAIEHSDDGENWQEFEISETTFFDLPENFIHEWYGAVIDRNPQRDMSMEGLKKFLPENVPLSNSANGSGSPVAATTPEATLPDSSS